METLRFLSFPFFPILRRFEESREREKWMPVACNGACTLVSAPSYSESGEIRSYASCNDIAAFVRRVIFVRARNNKQGRIFYPPPPRDSRTSDRGFNGRVVCLPVAITRDEGPACSYIPDHFTV